MNIDNNDLIKIRNQHPEYSTLQVQLTWELRQIQAANRDCENLIIEHAVKFIEGFCLECY